MKISQFVTALVVSCAASSVATADIQGYSQNFDALTASGSVLQDERFDDGSGIGWEFFSDNAGLGNYNGGAPGDGPQISALANDGAGNQFLNVYANYDNNAVHDNSSLRESISVYMNQGFTGADAALEETWFFDFVFASNPASPVTGDSQVGAFIRVFDPSFNLLDTATFDTLNAAAPTLSVTLSSGYTNGGFIQFGFNNVVGEYNGSGRLYDNVRFSNVAAVPEPASAAIVGLGIVGMFLRRRRRS
jgi:hypothetical protein